MYLRDIVLRATLRYIAHINRGLERMAIIEKHEVTKAFATEALKQLDACIEIDGVLYMQHDEFRISHNDSGEPVIEFFWKGNPIWSYRFDRCNLAGGDTMQMTGIYGRTGFNVL